MREGVIYSKKDSLYMPKIEIRKRLKKVIISGVSRMPDPGSYYGELSSHMDNYFKEFRKSLFVEFYFDYINSGSTKWIYSIVQHLESLSNEGGIVEISWKYDQDDESIELTGDVLKSQTKIPFKLIPVEV